MSLIPQIGSIFPLTTVNTTRGKLNLAKYANEWIVLAHLQISNANDIYANSDLTYLIDNYSYLLENHIQVLGLSSPNVDTTYYNTLPFPVILGDNLSREKSYPIKNDSSYPIIQLFILDPNQLCVCKLCTPELVSCNVPNFLSRLDKYYRPIITAPTTEPFDNINCPDLAPIVGEYVLGNPNVVNPNQLDFVTYAFALITPDGKLQPYSIRYLEELLALKKVNPNLKVLMAIGGWGAEGFSDAALTPASRYTFAREVQSFVNKYNLDGIDIDWEYPGSNVSGIKSRPEDKENFTLLLQALRDVLGPNKWLTVAGSGDDFYINNVEIDKIAPLIDYFNLMSYDLTAGETGENAAKHQANLFESPLGLPGKSVDGYVQNLIDAGMPSEKILLGVPFYGRYGATLTKTYDQILQEYLINNPNYSVRWDNTAKASYIVDQLDKFVLSYDNALALYFKGQYVRDNCLGGMFSWQSGMDKNNILSKFMVQSIKTPQLLANQLKIMLGEE